MKISSALRWLGISVNGLLCAAALITVLAGVAPVGFLILLAPATLVLLALLPSSPNLAITILACLASGFLILIGLFAVVGLGDYGLSSFDVAIAWTAALIVPAISPLSVLVWRVASQSNNSFKPNPHQVR
jgi:hypothetical protein